MTADTTTPTSNAWTVPRATACLALANGLILEGVGAGATGVAVGEVCFNTAMTGYQEILTDPSYAGQIITFTFPHIGNVGANENDVETVAAEAEHAARGCVMRAPITAPQNWRAGEGFEAWLKRRGIIALTGVDTRALASLIREKGMVNAAIAHDPSGAFDHAELIAAARAAPDMAGAELATGVSGSKALGWSDGSWTWDDGYRTDVAGEGPRVVALDYGIKRNILRLLADRGANVTVVPADASPQDIMALQPDGLFLSNGPGDPAATTQVVGETLKAMLAGKVPIFGICLGHQLLGHAIGANTVKMRQGHHGANHPVLDMTTGTVSIVSMNHGFAVDAATLPSNARQTHKSLFDGSNCGLELTDRPAFSVQFHPEASPGPQDSFGLFDRFMRMIEKAKTAPAQ